MMQYKKALTSNHKGSCQSFFIYPICVCSCCDSSGSSVNLAQTALNLSCSCSYQLFQLISHLFNSILRTGQYIAELVKPRFLPRLKSAILRRNRFCSANVRNPICKLFNRAAIVVGPGHNNMVLTLQSFHHSAPHYLCIKPFPPAKT